MSDELVYSVVIFRKDNQHVIIDAGTDYEKCRELHSKLDSQWVDCHKEQLPFRLEEPEITSFEPALIKEIKIMAGSKNSFSNNSHNPYVQRMKKQGFADSFPSQGGLDILDQGFKF